MVATPVEFTNGLTTTAWFTLHANSTLLTTFRDASALQSTFAVTAPGHHPDPTRTGLRAALLLNQT